MPRLGIGDVPGGDPGTLLQNWTRRSFIPEAINLVAKSTPLTAALMGAAKPIAGGVSQITVPWQTGAFVTSSWTDYSGKFPPPQSLSPGINGEWNAKILVTPIPFTAGEALVQWDAGIIPILAVRMNDVGNSQAEELENQLLTNATDGSQQIDGLPLIASATGSYAGQSRSIFPSLQANVIAAGAIDPTRASIGQYITSATKFNKGEMPDFGLAGPGTWFRLGRDYLGIEQLNITPGAAFDKLADGPRSGFISLMVGNVPVYVDHNMPEGTIYFFKRRYLSFYLHSAAAFAFTGFASTLPNYQLGYVGLVVTALETVCVRPSSVTKVTGLNFDSV